MKTIYQCDFCPGTSTETKEMVIHEMDCLFNPANRGCMSCNNFKNDYGECVKNLMEGLIMTDCDGWEEMKY